MEMQSCTAIDCYAYMNGGVLLIMHASGGRASGLVEDSMFSGCYSLTQAGGAIFQNGHAIDVIVRNNTFVNCRVTGSLYSSGQGCGGGAGAVERGSSCIYERCVFEYCTSVHGGGAIRMENPSSAILTECRFKDCSAVMDGGGIRIFRERWSYIPDLMMERIFCMNCTSSTTTVGQAIHIGIANSFTWSQLCIEYCGNTPVYSPMNQPEHTSLDSCDWIVEGASIFTNSHIEFRVHYNISCYQLAYIFMYIYSY